MATPALAQSKGGESRASAPEKFFKPGANILVKRNSGSAAPSMTVAANDAISSDTHQPHATLMAKYAIKFKNKKYRGEVCGTRVVQKTSGRGKTTLVMTVEKSVSAQVNAEFGFSAKGLSATVGFNTQKSYTVSNQTRYEVPKGKMGFVEAYPLYDMYEAQGYDMTEQYVGIAVALKPIGVCFNQWTQ
ncbi:hypothetical protein OG422_20710 [Streptomyces sp. NBC_01525]|uniref:hypothetical protein n=1 Tax=Streptomyces sp. NBC_01525 TaxID=2903893 RepID=UPI003865FEC3